MTNIKPRQAWKLQPILTDFVNIAPDPQKVHSYQQEGCSGTALLDLVHAIFGLTGRANGVANILFYYPPCTLHIGGYTEWTM